MKNKNFNSIEKSLIGIGININKIELMDKINIRLQIGKTSSEKLKPPITFQNYGCITDGDTVTINKKEIHIYRKATYVIYYGFQNKVIEKIFVTKDAKIKEIFDIINNMELKK